MESYNKEGPIIFALNASKRFGEKLGANGKVFVLLLFIILAS